MRDKISLAVACLAAFSVVACKPQPDTIKTIQTERLEQLDEAGGEWVLVLAGPAGISVNPSAEGQYRRLYWYTDGTTETVPFSVDYSRSGSIY